MNRQRIVIVDGDPSELDSARSVLEADGYEVLAFSGAEGAVADLKPHLVLVDMDAPEEVYRAGGARRRHARVLLYSSCDEETLRATARRLHVDGYVCKGDRSGLRLRVASVLDR